MNKKNKEKRAGRTEGRKEGCTRDEDFVLPELDLRCEDLDAQYMTT